LVRSGVTLASMSAATDSEFFAGVTLDFDAPKTPKPLKTMKNWFYKSFMNFTDKVRGIAGQLDGDLLRRHERVSA